MAFPDPSSQQYYPSPSGPQFNPGGGPNVQSPSIPQARTDTAPRINTAGLDQVRYPVNTTMGDLFKGIGGVADTLVKATDTVIKDKLTKELYEGVDKVRAEFGVEEALTRVAGGGPNGNSSGDVMPTDLSSQNKQAPTIVKKLGARLEGMQDALNSGDWSNSYYAARLETEVRRVREMFPGYREEIDKEVARITGVTPANYLRSALQQEAEAYKRKVEGKLDEKAKFMVQNANWLPPNWETLPFEEVQRQVIDNKGFEHRQDNLRKPRLSATGPDGEAMTPTQRTDWAVPAFTTAANNVVAKFMAQGAEGNLPINTITKMVNDQLTGKAPKWNENEEATIMGQLQYYEDTVRRAILAEGMRPHSPGKFGNYRSDIASEEKFKGIVDGALMPVLGLKESLVNKQFGITGTYARWSTATQDRAGADLMGKPGMAHIQAARTMFGDGVVNLWMTYKDKKGGQPIGDIARVLNDLIIFDSAKPDKPFLDNLGRRKPTAEQTGKKITSSDMSKMLDLHIAHATDPEIVKSVPPQTRAQVLKNTFTNLELAVEKGYIPVREYENFLTKTMNPAISAEIERLRSVDGDLADTYKKFTLRAFKAVYLKDIGSANQSIVDPWLKVELKDGQLIARLDPTNPRFKDADPSAVNYASHTVTNLNKGLRLLAPVLKANNMTVEDALTAVGVDLKAKKTGSVWDTVFEAIKKGPTEEGSKKPSTALGPDEERKARSKENIEKQKKLRGNLSDMNITGVEVEESPVNPKSGEPGNPQRLTPMTDSDKTWFQKLANVKADFSRLLKEAPSGDVEDRRTEDDKRYEELHDRWQRTQRTAETDLPVLMNSDYKGPKPLTAAELKWLEAEHILQEVKKMRVYDDYVDEFFKGADNSQTAKEIRDKKKYYKRRNPRPQE